MTTDQPTDRVNIEQSASGRLEGRVLQYLLEVFKPQSDSFTQSAAFDASDKCHKDDEDDVDGNDMGCED